MEYSKGGYFFESLKLCITRISVYFLSLFLSLRFFNGYRLMADFS